MIKNNFCDNWFFGPKGDFVNFGPPKEMAAVTLPHDAMINEERDKDAAAGGRKGFYPDGSYEYMKELDVPAHWENKRLILEFEGIYRDARIFINGAMAAYNPNGYTGTYVPLNNYLNYGKTNTINVFAHTGQDQRWYTGAGIYRPVNLWMGGLAYIAPGNVKITTVTAEADYAVIRIETTVNNDSHRRLTLRLSHDIFDSNGGVVGTDEIPVTLYAGQSASLCRQLVLNGVHTWSTGSPVLYLCKTYLSDSKNIQDESCVTFGIRTMALDAKKGLRINGETIKLRGACIHHDNGIVGAATFAASEKRRISMLKEAGFNAIRMAHHPASKALLDACDETGMLVMDELYDMWTVSKTDNDYSAHIHDWWERDIENMVNKDYNHPCVIVYSIGNEIPETGNSSGFEWGRKLSAKLRSLDAGRYTINCINGMLSAFDKIPAELTNGAYEINQAMTEAGQNLAAIMSLSVIDEATEESFACVDIAGYNYMDSRYEKDSKNHPNRIICGSETYPSYIDQNWSIVKKFPSIIGDFTWAGWDYIGEAGVGKVEYEEGARYAYGGWPWLAAWCGDIDITGNRRPASFYREIVYGLRKKPYIAVERPEHYYDTPAYTPWSWSDTVAGWSWSGFEEKPVRIEVYSDAEEIALLLNDVEIGRQQAGEEKRYKAFFEANYLPGTLTAVAYTNGIESGRHSISTAKGKMKICIENDIYSHLSHGEDLIYLPIAIKDEKGIVFHTERVDVSIEIEGFGVLQGYGSANPAPEHGFQKNICTSFDGRLLAAVRRTAPGEIKVRLASEGFETASIALV